MRLSAILSRDFEPAVRSRGQSYYVGRKVRVLTGSKVSLRAEVMGTDPYQVTIALQEKELHLSCTCPYFTTDAPCKHLWASVLAAEAKGFVTDAERLAKVERVYDEPAWGEEEDILLERPAFRERKPKPAPDWRKIVGAVQPEPVSYLPPVEHWPERRQILYTIDMDSTRTAGQVVVVLFTRDRKQNGDWTRKKDLRLTRRQIATIPDPQERELLSLLTGGRQHSPWTLSEWSEQGVGRYQLTQALAEILLPRMSATGRLFLLTGIAQDLVPVTWDEGPPWEFALKVEPSKPGQFTLTGAFRRGDEQMPLKEPLMILVGGFIFTQDKIARLASDTPFPWIALLRQAGEVQVPEKDKDELLATLLQHPHAARVASTPELPYEEITEAPRPRLTIRSKAKHAWGVDWLRGDLGFEYGGQLVDSRATNKGLYDRDARRFLRRDPVAEAAAADKLREAGLRWNEQEVPPHWELTPAKLSKVVRFLVDAGWKVEAEGKAFRRPGEVKLAVNSGVDWFELHGEVEYGGKSVKLPALLAALRKGEQVVALGNGEYGLLPEEWLDRFGLLANLGSADAEHVRFKRNQAGVLDALLASQPEISYDEAFGRVRERLKDFGGVRTAPQPAGFVGQLRDYQREGLGWMQFLQEFQFGGCLADDMGVGKTAQVLALLEHQRESGVGRPSLVVVPRSLVFNWRQEAEKFTPQLRVLDYTGTQRRFEDIEKYDLVLTTYGTLRRDALQFKDVEFDYLILDEAQAIKNANTESAKAARLLRGRQRLAMSGTPVENHLGELWSLFEFLNPGMLGAASVLQLGSSAKELDEDTRLLLARALRPFILRRTKEQVAKELPAKVEQTIYCELEPGQRKLYNELRQHYRDSLLTRIDSAGMAKSKIQVLEALLRLRQAACHPGLLDDKRKGESSAKFDVLLAQLSEVLSEGHKALVFSQFTSLLALLKTRLDADKVTYEYLDGRTKDRQARVERFQNDPACPLFLISLKAGGLGLNLTAAEYVFLLDPWWNPAVEMQAVDRAHRIGQVKQVFAYRLIAQDTVEEKVLELQKSKKALADAIVGADNSLIRELKREDLELLLS